MLNPKSDSSSPGGEILQQSFLTFYCFGPKFMARALYGFCNLEGSSLLFDFFLLKTQKFEKFDFFVVGVVVVVVVGVRFRRSRDQN